MKLSKQERMQLFLNQNYYTLSELAQHSNASEAEILTLQTAQCIPGHSYEMRQIVVFSSPVSQDSADLATVRYYHPSITIWIREALLASKTMNLSQVAMQIKKEFSEQLTTTFCGVKTPGCQSFDQAWRYWIDGTWGICLKEISFDCMAKKELSRQCIAEIMAEDPAIISEKKRDKLTDVVENYIAASLDFDPYGIRHILAEDAIEKFQLKIDIDNKYLGHDFNRA